MAAETNFSKELVVDFVHSLQDQIVQKLESIEPASQFRETSWERPGGGGGRSRVLSGGKVFEKAGVNVSVVHGELPEAMQKRLGSTAKDFFAAGISLVIHPANPHVPTVHANYRYFEQSDRSWFGGGADLTPYVLYEEDAQHFHQELKTACDTYSGSAYADFKKACDEYFFIKHRDEHRGVGGIFFDYLSNDLPNIFEFVKKASSAFTKAYCPIVERRKDLKFSEREKAFQLLRRGRYVEFNLVYDRGTLFGLETKGNIESILMSLPPEVQFAYSPDLETNEAEKKLMKVIREPREWIATS